MTDVRARPPQLVYTHCLYMSVGGVLSAHMGFGHGPYYSLDPIPDHGVALQGVQWIAICLGQCLKFIARLRTYGCSQPPKSHEGHETPAPDLVRHCKHRHMTWVPHAV